MSCCSAALGLAGSGIHTGSNCARCWPGLTETLVQEHNLLDTPTHPPFFVWECSLVQGILMARMQLGWGLQAALAGTARSGVRARLCLLLLFTSMLLCCCSTELPGNPPLLPRPPPCSPEMSHFPSRTGLQSATPATELVPTSQSLHPGGSRCCISTESLLQSPLGGHPLPLPSC